MLRADLRPANASRQSRTALLFSQCDYLGKLTVKLSTSVQGFVITPSLSAAAGLGLDSGERDDTLSLIGSTRSQFTILPSLCCRGTATFDDRDLARLAGAEYQIRHRPCWIVEILHAQCIARNPEMKVVTEYSVLPHSICGSANVCGADNIQWRTQKRRQSTSGTNWTYQHTCVCIPENIIMDSKPCRSLCREADPG